MDKKLIKVNGHYLTLNHYKEPLKKVEKDFGFGYYGALLSNQDGTHVQCHVCGKMFEDLAGHIMVHKLKAKQYKETFQLARTTALCSEKIRLEHKKRYLKWWASLSADKKQEIKEAMVEARKKRREGQPTIRLETKNKRGTCPDQVLDKLIKVSKKMGRTPSKKEFIQECGTHRYVHLIYKNFGSWKSALELAGLNPKKREFNGTKGLFKYDDYDLLAFMRDFTRRTKQIPTTTDFNRGLLPSAKVYTQRWGSLEEARRKAGVYKIIGGD